MLNIWGWLRSRFGRGPKKAPIKPGIEWDTVPFSFATDWCVSAIELQSLIKESLDRSSNALRKALEDAERRGPP